MGTKQNPGAFDCYANAAPDEPMFVLLARSRYSAALVNLYAAMKRREALDTPGFHWEKGTVDKIEEAEQCANSMVEWRLQQGQLDDVAGLRALAEGVAMLAEQLGVVVRIDLQPLQPLRMGNYCHAVSVYPRHAPGPGERGG